MAGRMDLSGFFDYPEGLVEKLEEEMAFLPHASEEEWGKLLAYTETRRFSSGDPVIRAGEDDRALYLLTEGRLEATLPGAGPAGTRVRVMQAPTVVGDVAFIDGKPRSATVTAGTDGEMLRSRSGPSPLHR